MPVRILERVAFRFAHVALERGALSFKHAAERAKSTVKKMKQQTFAMPNSLDCAIDAIDETVPRRVLTRTSATVLKLLYLLGWDDGFTSIPRIDASLIFGFHDVEIARALRQLASFGFIRLRQAGESHVIEITALSGCALTGGLPLTWWRYYQVDVDSQTE